MPKRTYRKHRGIRRKWPTDPDEREQFRKKTRSEDNRRDYLELRNAIFNAYGKSCDCCSDSTPEFLCLDHIHGGGGKERKQAGNGVRLWRKLQKLKFPPGYRTLCFNCNAALAFRKTCPHKASAAELVRLRNINSPPK